MKRIWIAAVAAFFVTTSLPAFAGSVASTAKRGVPVAYCSVNVGTGAINAWGGKGTTAALGTPGAGYVTVSFTGKYPDDITAGKVVLQATAESASYGVSNAYVFSATPTDITVLVSNWKSDDLTLLTNNTFLTVMIGN